MRPISGVTELPANGNIGVGCALCPFSLLGWFADWQLLAKGRPNRTLPRHRVKPNTDARTKLLKLHE